MFAYRSEIRLADGNKYLSMSTIIYYVPARDYQGTCKRVNAPYRPYTCTLGNPSYSKLFLDIVPSCLDTVTRVMRGQPQRISCN